MSKQEFLNNFRIARNFFAHPMIETDGPRLQKQEMEQSVARAAIWLTPKSVKSFSPDDFAELDADRQTELRSAIAEFLDVAKQVPPTEPPSEGQLVMAKAAFEKALSLARSFDHKVMKAVCQDYAKLAPDAAGQRFTSTGQRVPQEIHDIAEEFVALQLARNQADYDTGTIIAQAQADNDVMRAELAFLDWITVRSDPAADTFLAELLCRGIPKR